MLEAKRRSKQLLSNAASVKRSICQRLGAARKLAGDSVSNGALRKHANLLDTTRASNSANGASESMVLSETGTPPPWSVSLLFHGLVCSMA